MNSAPAIAEVLRKFISDFRRHDVFIPDASLVEKHSRAVGARQLAELFDEVSRETAECLAPKRFVKKILINAVHARNERERRRLQQENGIEPAAWGATVNDAGNLSVDGVDLAELAGEYGTPLHVVSHSRLLADYERFESSFTSLYPKTAIGYSYKTNPLPGVIKAAASTPVRSPKSSLTLSYGWRLNSVFRRNESSSTVRARHVMRSSSPCITASA